MFHGTTASRLKRRQVAPEGRKREECHSTPTIEFYTSRTKILEAKYMVRLFKVHCTELVAKWSLFVGVKKGQ